ncbi:peroxidase 11-like [Curcuma longa]|uniref:peroxidase 11-like n=1 Tax=Curcuma longa TaxID=136217 RepID=UPI003D9DCEF6
MAILLRLLLLAMDLTLAGISLAFAFMIFAFVAAVLCSTAFIQHAKVKEQSGLMDSEFRYQNNDKTQAPGCDGSVLLDDTATLIGEKHADQNVNSLQGFELVDKIKEKLEADCPGVVSCADVLAIAARDATILVGGPYWDVPVGRLDSKTASVDLANSDIPTPQQPLAALIAKFLEKGLSVTDMVALVGSHTVGMSRCVNFRERIYGGDFQLTSKNEPSSQANLAKLKDVCPADGGDDNVSAMDYYSPTVFDNAFFETLLQGSGVLSSDQEMYSSLLGFQTSRIVDKYWADAAAFFKDFADGMVKMGNITNPEAGEVRKNCRFINI